MPCEENRIAPRISKTDEFWSWVPRPCCRLRLDRDRHCARERGLVFLARGLAGQWLRDRIYSWPESATHGHVCVAGGGGSWFCLFERPCRHGVQRSAATTGVHFLRCSGRKCAGSAWGTRRIGRGCRGMAKRARGVDGVAHYRARTPGSGHCLRCRLIFGAGAIERVSSLPRPSCRAEREFSVT